MGKDLAPIPIYAGVKSDLDREFRKVQEEFRANSGLGPFSTFVKRATVDAWRRGGGRLQAAELPDAIQQEIEQLRREIRELRAARMMPASPAPDGAQKEEALDALDALVNLARMDFR